MIPLRALVAIVLAAAPAAVEESGVNGWVGIGANAGAIVLISWLVQHTFKHTIPRLADQFSKTLEDMRKSFTEALDKQHNNYIGVIDKLREDSRAERREFIDTIDKLRNDGKEERRETLSKLEDVRRELAVVVSALKDRDQASTR